MILESCFPTEGGGGAEGQVRTLGRYLTARGIPVRIVVPMVPRGPQQEYDTVDGVPVWRIPYPSIRKIGGLVLLVKLAWFLFRHRRNYDVIHAHIAHNLAVVSSVVGRLLGKKVIVKATGSLELAQGILDSRNRRLAAMLTRAGLKHASYFQATSSEIRKCLVENGFDAGRVRVIPNAVDIERFSGRANAGTHRNGPLTAVYVGRLEDDKGTDVLVPAWIDAFPRDANARLLLVGEGSQREILDRLIAENGRRDIRLLGPQEDVAPFLAEADFAVLPSRHEGLSNALLECMAVGLPVLGTRVSGTVDFIEPERSGWLVDPGDRTQMAEQLRRVGGLGRPALDAMGQRARERVSEIARIDAVTRKLLELYEIDGLRPVPVDGHEQDGCRRTRAVDDM